MDIRILTDIHRGPRIILPISIWCKVVRYLYLYKFHIVGLLYLTAFAIYHLHINTLLKLTITRICILRICLPYYIQARIAIIHTIEVISIFRHSILTKYF